MRRGARLSAAFGVLGLVLGLVAGCGGASNVPEEDHWIGVDVGPDPVESGRAFPVTVTRVWHKRLAAAAWDDAALAPLELQLATLDRDEDGERVRETRIFRAWAFALDDVLVPAVPFAARPQAGGETQTVHAPAFIVRVRPTLLPSAPGAPELPGSPLSDPPSRAPWVGAGLGCVILLGLGLLATRRRREPAPPVEAPAEALPAPAPHAIALERLRRLRAGDGDVAAVTEVVREYVASRFDVHAPTLSTEEVLATPVGGGEANTRLAAILRLGDRTKFAAYAATAREREAHLAEAEAFARETAVGAAS